MMILAAFSSCCCYEFWLPFPPAAAEVLAAAAAAGPRMGKHHGVKDGEAPKSDHLREKMMIIFLLLLL